MSTSQQFFVIEVQLRLLGGGGGKGESKGSAGRGRGKGMMPGKKGGTLRDETNGPLPGYLEGIRLGLTAHEENRGERLRQRQREFEQELPDSIKKSLQPRLSESDFHSSTIRTADSLDRHGGVAYVNSVMAAEVRSRVGFTLQPTAVVHKEDPSQIGLRGCLSTKEWLQLGITTADGFEYVSKYLYITQLGNGKKMERFVEEALDEIAIDVGMSRVIFTFEGGIGDPAWCPDMITGQVVTDIILAHGLKQFQFSDIVIRQGSTATAMVQDDAMMTLYKGSGNSHVYMMPAVDNSDRERMNVYFYGPNISYQDALAIAESYRTEPIFAGMAHKTTSNSKSMAFASCRVLMANVKNKFLLNSGYRISWEAATNSLEYRMEYPLYH